MDEREVSLFGVGEWEGVCGDVIGGSEGRLEGAIDPLPVIPLERVWSCGVCGWDLSGVGVVARYCPGCGRRLGDGEMGHSQIVLAYASALLHLGWRYEHGRGMMRNVREAGRCYAKAGRLKERVASSR
jgi:hypothetical protein